MFWDWAVGAATIGSGGSGTGLSCEGHQPCAIRKTHLFGEDYREIKFGHVDVEEKLV